jgi:Lipase (class 3)
VTQIRNIKRDTFAYAGYNVAKNEVIFAFRGTDGADFQNWLTNLWGFKTDFPVIPDAAVHTGFFVAYKDIQPQVNAMIEKMLDKYSHLNPSIFVTGHSLGGALAVFAAIDIKVHHRYQDVTLYTYGQPRVGNEAFSRFVDRVFWGKHERVTNDDDMVPHVPPRILGYYHSGNEVWYEGEEYNGKYKECVRNTEITDLESPDCSNSQWFTLGINTHVNYMGVHISGICDFKQPEDLTKGATRNEDYSSYTEVITNDSPLALPANRNKTISDQQPTSSVVFLE